jgi:acetylornithine deacetylase/succinyl-diaminopimelate desuccinylase-like protein
VPPDRSQLRATVEHLQAIERPSASDGERRAAEWIRDRLQEQGCGARIEEERATGSFTLPAGLLSAVAALAGLTRGGRALAAAGGLAAAAAIVDDVSSGPRLFRRLLRTRPTYNVVAEAGDPDARETLVFVAHHDAARGGLIFHPGPTRWVADTFPRWYARRETSPRLMQLVVAGPALAGAGALLGRPGLRRAGGFMALGSALAMADIATRAVVPGANDNLASVALLIELARLLRDDPPDGVRVLLVSTGSEESLLEGMRGFVARHAAALPRERTRFVVLECIGAAEAILRRATGLPAAPSAPAGRCGGACARASRPTRWWR